MQNKTLILFAHPDDELLWMGGTLLKYRDRLKIDFACLTIPFNKPRVKGLFRLDRFCDTGVIMCLGYEDNTAVWREGAEVDFDDIWLDCIDFDKYDLIFSHNMHGEYYHPHHIFIHNSLKQRAIPFISFGHLRETQWTVNLTEEEVKRKQDAIRDLYYSEFDRCMHKFTYWRTQTERFRMEIQGSQRAESMKNRFGNIIKG